MNFKDKVVIVTGGARGIGKVICEEFRKNGAKVCTIDKEPNDYFIGDVGDEKQLIEFSQKVLTEHKKIDFLINNAMTSMGGIDTCSYDDFNYALKVGITAPYYLTKLLMNHFNENGCIINISSTRAKMSQPFTESYSAAKGGIEVLTHALAMSLAGRVRVNSISPGWIDTDFIVYEGPDAYQHPVGRVGNPLDISNMVLFLCSEKAGFINGENITIDGGMSKQMIYHNDFNWTLK